MEDAADQRQNINNMTTFSWLASALKEQLEAPFLHFPPELDGDLVSTAQYDVMLKNEQGFLCQ